jgi:hypothetical protein
MATGVLRIAAFGRYGFTGSGGTSRTGLAGHLVRPGVGPAPVTRGISAPLVAGETVGDQLNRTKSRLVPVQLIPRLVLAAGGSALLAARPHNKDPRWALQCRLAARSQACTADCPGVPGRPASPGATPTAPS